MRKAAARKPTSVKPARPSKPKERPRYLAEVPKPSDEALMELFYGGAGRTRPQGTVLLAVDGIDADPNQPRKTFDPTKIEELAESIKAEGLIQPIAVRPHNERYVIVAGERRWRAHKLLGRKEIEAKVLAIDAAQAFRVALIENVHRDSLLALDEARAYQRLLNDQKVSQADLARQLGLDRRRVSEKLSLLRLPEPIQGLLSAHADTFGERHALLLAGARPDFDVVPLAKRCADEGWSLVRLRAALDRPPREPRANNVFQSLEMVMNRHGGFTLTVRARNRDEVPTLVGELERTLEGLRRSLEVSPPDTEPQAERRDDISVS